MTEATTAFTGIVMCRKAGQCQEIFDLKQRIRELEERLKGMNRRGDSRKSFRNRARDALDTEINELVKFIGEQMAWCITYQTGYKDRLDEIEKRLRKLQ